MPRDSLGRWSKPKCERQRLSMRLFPSAHDRNALQGAPCKRGEILLGTALVVRKAPWLSCAFRFTGETSHWGVAEIVSARPGNTRFEFRTTISARTAPGEDRAPQSGRRTQGYQRSWL